MRSNIAKVFLLSTILLGALDLYSGQQRQQPQCSDQEHLMFGELTSRVATVGDPVILFPENSTQLKRWCSDSYKYIVDIEKYKNKCLLNLAKQATGLTIYALRNSLKGYCKNNSKKGISFISSAGCFNANKKIVDRCYHRFVDELQGAKGLNDKMKIPHLCCSYYRSLDCYEERMAKKPKCNLAKINDMIGYFEGITAQVTNLLCTIYTRDSDSCERIGLPPKRKSDLKRAKSFAVPLVELLLSFSEV